MYIESDRLRLEPVLEEDFEKIMEWMNDLELTKYMQKPYFQTWKSMYDYCNAMQEPNMWLKIIVKDTGVHIGNISLKDNSAQKYYSEISIIIGDKSLHGKGYASEAIQALTDYCFKVRDIHCIQAGTVIDNLSCMKTFIKAGYKVDATLPERVYCHGLWRDIAILSKIRRQYDSRTKVLH
jgi:ribosomal-protein-alanine N-acetyltransferase